MSINKSKLKDIAQALKVTDQSDYRTFLGLVYAEAKAIDPSYSYVRLSEDLGLASTNAHSVIRGRRPLTLKSAERICDALGLKGVQKRYFLTLVSQTRTKSATERDLLFEKRLKLKQQVLPTALDQRHLAFFENWYNAAILELLRMEHARDNAEWIAENICPAVPLNRIRESLELLTELGYLARDQKRNRLFPNEVTISTGNDASGLAIHSYHRQMIKLALAAIDDIASEHRDINALTIALSPSLEQKLKEDMNSLRKRYLQLAAEEENPTEIVQFNVQIFPLNKKRGDRS